MQEVNPNCPKNSNYFNSNPATGNDRTENQLFQH